MMTVKIEGRYRRGSQKDSVSYRTRLYEIDHLDVATVGDRWLVTLDGPKLKNMVLDIPFGTIPPEHEYCEMKYNHETGNEEITSLYVENEKGKTVYQIRRPELIKLS